MNTFQIDLKKIPIASAIFIILLLSVRLLFFFNSPQDRLIGIIPDDAFYYIQMASHRAEEGVWTFDGTSPATGFHFLYGYFLVFIFKLYPEINWTSIYLIVGAISCLTISASVYFLVKTATEIYGKAAALAAILPFLSFPIIMQSTVMMESWLVILLSSLTVFFVAKQEEASPKFLFALFLVGLLGSLSRTDYGMLPGFLFCTIFLAEKFKITPTVVRSFAILMGAFIGVCVVLIQNYFISGQLAQASAQTKLFWSSVAGHSIFAPLQLVLSISFPTFDFIERQGKIILLLASFLAVTYSSIKSIKLANEENKSLPAALLIGCALTVVGYIFFYRHNSGALQPWYSSNFIAPISITMTAVFHYLFGRRAFITFPFVFLVYLLSGSKDILAIPWLHQAGMMNAGLYVRTLDGSSTFAAWNAGIISYFSEKPLVNIDGLTNDEVLPYIKSNKLMDYLKLKRIDYVVDYKEMLDNKNLRLRGGYDDERVFRCLVPIEPVDGGSSGWGSSKLMLFKVDAACL